MSDEFADLASLLSDPIDVDAADLVTEPLEGDALGGMSPNWEGTLDHHGDWDGDGIPNYADHWFGPGAESPFGASAGEPSDSNVFETETTFDGDDSKSDSIFGEATGDEISADAGFETEDPLSGRVVAGTPESDANHWHPQEDDYSCAVACQRGVLESLTGKFFSEGELSKMACDNDWYDPDCGTQPEAVGNILEAHGVPVERRYGTTLEELFDTLRSKEKVIVGVDANEIWTPITGADGVPAEQPNAGHAVWITGIEMSDNGQLQVICNDTGVPDGCGRPVAMADFINAWDDYGNFATITNVR